MRIAQPVDFRVVPGMIVAERWLLRGRKWMEMELGRRFAVEKKEERRC
jgi:hypothetical protein